MIKIKLTGGKENGSEDASKESEIGTYDDYKGILPAIVNYCLKNFKYECKHTDIQEVIELPTKRLFQAKVDVSNGSKLINFRTEELPESSD